MVVPMVIVADVNVSLSRVKPSLRTSPEIVPTRSAVPALGEVWVIVNVKVSVPLHFAAGHALTSNMPNAMFPPTKLEAEVGAKVMGNRLGLLKVPAVEKVIPPAMAKHGTKTANATSRTILLVINFLSSARGKICAPTTVLV